MFENHKRARNKNETSSEREGLLLSKTHAGQWGPLLIGYDVTESIAVQPCWLKSSISDGFFETTFKRNK